MQRIPYTHFVKGPVRNGWMKILLLGMAYLVLQGLLIAGPNWELPGLKITEPAEEWVPCTAAPDLNHNFYFQQG